MAQLVIVIFDFLGAYQRNSSPIGWRSKGCPAGEQLEHNCPARPRIHRESVPSFEGLRSPVIESSTIGEEFQFLMIVAGHPAKVEVDELDGAVTLIIEDILWFDIPVADSLLM